MLNIFLPLRERLIHLCLPSLRRRNETIRNDARVYLTDGITLESAFRRCTAARRTQQCIALVTSKESSARRANYNATRMLNAIPFPRAGGGGRGAACWRRARTEIPHDFTIRHFLCNVRRCTEGVLTEGGIGEMLVILSR